MKHDTFIFRRAWYDAIVSLPEEARLQVFEAICQYDSDQFRDIAEMVEDPVARGVFIAIKSDIDKTLANYEAVLVKRSEAGKKGMESRWHNKHNTDNKCYENITSVTSVIEDNKHNTDNNNTHTNNIDISDNIDNNDNSNTDISDSSNTRTRKKKNTVDLTKSLKDRKYEFGMSLESYQSLYSHDMLQDFFGYWAEKTKDGKKMRWELEKTWDLDFRLRRWERTDKHKAVSSSPSTSAPESKIDKVKRAGDGAREIIRQMYAAQNSDTKQLNS